ncbi:MAG: glycogen synthase [Firmicutes bacterium]|nr:glycogen synthase [Bacillota bacterium]
MPIPSVTIFTREYPPDIYGGAGIHVRELAAALHRFTTVEVRCFGPHGPEGPVAACAFSPAGKAWPEEADPRALKVLDPLFVDLRMASVPVRTDVVHCHTWYTTFAGFLAGTLYRKPLVVTLHSLEPLRPWKEEQLGPGGYRLSTWMEKIGILSADLVIAVSGAMREDLLQVYPVPAEKVRVVHNGIDPERFRATDEKDALRRRGIEEPYLLFVGRISRQKGIDVLLAAAPLLPPEVTVVICAGAADTEELAAAMRTRAGKLPNVRWLEETVPHGELVQLYSHAAVFVCPSRYEPFGLINLEAMACGRPVVASNIGGIPEVVADGITGLLVPPEDPGALAAAVRRILADPGKAAGMGAAGRRRVEEEFTWEKVARKTLEVYAEAVEIHRRVNGD